MHRCPCCHSRARVYFDDFLCNYPYYVSCDHCGFSGPYAETKERAVEAWERGCSE